MDIWPNRLNAQIDLRGRQAMRNEAEVYDDAEEPSVTECLLDILAVMESLEKYLGRIEVTVDKLMELAEENRKRYRRD